MVNRDTGALAESFAFTESKAVADDHAEPHSVADANPNAYAYTDPVAYTYTDNYTNADAHAYADTANRAPDSHQATLSNWRADAGSHPLAIAVANTVTLSDRGADADGLTDTHSHIVREA